MDLGQNYGKMQPYVFCWLGFHDCIVCSVTANLTAESSEISNSSRTYISGMFTMIGPHQRSSNVQFVVLSWNAKASDVSLVCRPFRRDLPLSPLGFMALSVLAFSARASAICGQVSWQCQIVSPCLLDNHHCPLHVCHKRKLHTGTAKICTAHSLPFHP